MGFYGHEVNLVTENNIILGLDMMSKEINESVFSDDNIVNESAKEKIKSIVDIVVKKIEELIKLIKRKLSNMINAIKIRTIGKGTYPVITLKSDKDLDDVAHIKPKDIMLTEYDESKMEKAEKEAEDFLKNVIGDSDNIDEQTKHIINYLFDIGKTEVETEEDKEKYTYLIKKINDRLQKSIDGNIKVLEEFKGILAKYNTTAWITNDDETKVKLVGFNVKIANIIVKKIRLVINVMITMCQIKEYKQMCKYVGADPGDHKIINNEE